MLFHVALVLLLSLFMVSCAALTESSAEDGNPETVTARYLRFEVGGTTAYGVLEGDRVRQLAGDLFGRWEETETTYALDDVKILVPSEPTKVMALAGNYRDHLGEKPVPPHPEPFFKAPSCLQRHEGEIVQPADTEAVHYEAEVVVVIGKRASNVSVDEALEFVFGVTCGNDVSARVWQENDVQWWRAKGSDTFGPCGPYIATGVDYDDLDVELRVNGAIRQKSNTKNLIHGIAETVSFISTHVTLEPGDLVFTGTPGTTEGLQPGDVVEVEIRGVGVLRNRVVAPK